MQITRLQHYPAAQGYTHTCAHTAGLQQNGQTENPKPNIPITIQFSVAECLPKAPAGHWWIRGTVSHILLFCAFHLGIYRNTHVCVMQKRMQKKTEEPFWIQNPVAYRLLDDCRAATQKVFADGAPTGPEVSVHIHQYTFYPSTVDGFSCGKLLKTD